MSMTLYRGGALQRYEAADFVLAREGIFTHKRLFGFLLPSLWLPCELRGLPPLLTRSAALEAEVSLCPPGPSYHILTPHTPLPGVDPTRLYQYVIAGNGVFVLARSRDVEACLPLAIGSLPGLVSCTPGVHFLHPRVPARLVENLFARARAACLFEAQERLFYLLWEGGWRLHEPAQVATEWSVQANHATSESFTAALEGHSHHRASAFFSAGDDTSELDNGGCRLFFVLGRIVEQPEILVRFCVHGYGWVLPASLFFEVPQGVRDALPDASWKEEGR